MNTKLPSSFVATCGAGILCSLTGSAEPSPTNHLDKTTQHKKTNTYTEGIKKISAVEYQLGRISLNTKSQKIQFQATLEMNGDQLIEYLLVTNKGKSHESILVTEIRPFNLNLALKLLSYEESNTLFNEQAVSALPLHPATPPKASHIHVTVQWQHQGVRHSIPLSECVQHLKTQTSPCSPWIYTGSWIRKKQLVAELEGNIFALQMDRGALANCPAYHQNSEDLWRANTKKLPPLGTKVQFILTPSPPENR